MFDDLVCKKSNCFPCILRDQLFRFSYVIIVLYDGTHFCSNVYQKKKSSTNFDKGYTVHICKQNGGKNLATLDYNMTFFVYLRHLY